MPDIAQLLRMLNSGGMFRFLSERARTEAMLALASVDHVEVLQRLLTDVSVRTHDQTTDTPAGTMLLDCSLPGQAQHGSSAISLFTDAVACFIAGADSLLRPPCAGRRYYLLTTPRSGSTFLCDMLTSTHHLGTPAEHLKPWVRDYLVAAGLSFARLIDDLHRYSDSPNGVFGSKVIIYDLFAFLPHFADEVFEELRRAHVFLLLRGDKAAQAVSNVRCNQLSLYHVREAELATSDLGNIAFEADVADIFAKERWLLRQEGDLMDELRQRDIRPTILSYEACVQSRKTAAAILDEIAAIMGTELDEGFVWPDLVPLHSDFDGLSWVDSRPREWRCCSCWRASVSIETSRLILRRPTLSDVPRLFEFLGNAEAMRYTHADASLRQCRRRVAIHEWQRRRNGYAPWTVVTKVDARIIGWGGLYDDPFDQGWGIEVAYYFEPAAWGRGYATELTLACTTFADDVLGLPEIRAFARPENLGSRRVLEKAGFEVVRFVPEMDRLLYRRGRLD